MLENPATMSPLLFTFRETGLPVTILSLIFLRRWSCRLLVGLEKGTFKAETPVLTRKQSLCQALFQALGTAVDITKIHTLRSSHSRGGRQTISKTQILQTLTVRTETQRPF